MSNTKENHQSNFDAALLAITLDLSAAQSLQAQLTDTLRRLILGDDGIAGMRLPSTRRLAEELSVSRTTVQVVYDQLIAEGYLEARVGSGTFIPSDLPHLGSPPEEKDSAFEPTQPWRPFHPGIPDQRLVPHLEWAKHLEAAWARPEPDLLATPDPFGWFPLRKAIASHLGAWRGLECQASQVVITSGATEGFELILGGILKRNARVAIEDPGWPSLQRLLPSVSKCVTPIRVDGHGLDPQRLETQIDAVVVTPSRHYPTGVTMPLARRVDLLKFSRCNDALIIEDDYDSEFRFKGAPLPSLAGLDGLRNTIYMGSFSKLLSPSLRLGYLVIPKGLQADLRLILSNFGNRASLVPQPALASFMSTGGFAKHLRKTRRTYARRREFICKELERLDAFLSVRQLPSGMHIVCNLTDRAKRRYDDVELVHRCKERGLNPRALSAHSVLPNPFQGLLLGFSHCDEDALSGAVDILEGVIRS